MIETLKQIVPSEICLTCKGCCRFEDEKSIWRPQVSEEEIIRLRGEVSSGRALSQCMLNGSNHIKTVVCDGQNICRFLTLESNFCKIYELRPFECRLYPFVLMKDKDKAFLTAHLACPFIQNNLEAGSFKEYINYLKEFFFRPSIVDLIKRNSLLIGTYENCNDELKRLFVLR